MSKSLEDSHSSEQHPRPGMFVDCVPSKQRRDEENATDPAETTLVGIRVCLRRAIPSVTQSASESPRRRWHGAVILLALACAGLACFLAQLVIGSNRSRVPPPTQTFGTSVGFVADAEIAARQATQEHKLVFLMHISGHFEDARFT